MTGFETFGAHSAVGAPAVARVFLPLVDASNGERTTAWRAVHDRAPIELTADVSWIDYLRWGTGNGSFGTEWRPSMGRAPESTIRRIAALMVNVAGSDAEWMFSPFPEMSSLPDAPPPGSIALDRFVALWVDRPLPGRLRCAGPVLLSAPAYADSVIVSGPSTLVATGEALGLEMRRVSAHDRLPTMQW